MLPGTASADRVVFENGLNGQKVYINQRWTRTSKVGGMNGKTN